MNIINPSRKEVGCHPTEPFFLLFPLFGILYPPSATAGRQSLTIQWHSNWCLRSSSHGKQAQPARFPKGEVSVLFTFFSNIQPMVSRTLLLANKFGIWALSCSKIDRFYYFISETTVVLKHLLLDTLGAVPWNIKMKYAMKYTINELTVPVG